MKQVARYALIVLATLATLYLLWLLHAVVGIFVLSLFFAATVRPIINRLKGRGMRTGIALALTYGGLVLFLVLIVLTLSRPLTVEGQALINSLGNIYDSGRARWAVGTGVQQMIASQFPPPNDLYESLAADDGRVLANVLLRAGQTVGTVAAALVLVMIISIYWTIDQAHFERVWLALVRPEHRARAREIWRTTEWGIGSYLRNEGAQAVIAFLLLWLGYALMDLRYPTIQAIAGALAWLIPVVGVIFAILPAVLGAIGAGVTMTIVSVIYTILVLLLLEFVVQPRLFRRRLYNPILVIVMLVPLADGFGLLGLLAAPPLAVAIQTLLSSLLQRRDTGKLPIDATSEVEALSDQLLAIQLHEKIKESPELSSMAERLEELLEEAQRALQTGMATSGK
jgi:putative permease